MANKRRGTTSPVELAQAAMPDAPPVPSSDLGPAVTQEFSDALGLHELTGRGSTGRTTARLSGLAAPAAPTPAPTPTIDYSKLITKMLQLVDAATSAALGIEAEQPKDLETSAECMMPWITAHAGDVTNETGMRLLALSGLVTFIAMKVIRWSQKPKPKKERPNVATAPEDDLETVQA